MLAEKIRLEQAMENFSDETKELEGLEKERERLQRELDGAEQRDAVNKVPLWVLQLPPGTPGEGV